MKKSTLIVILLIYFASIVIVGFFGIAVRVGEEIDYVQSIQVEIKTLNDDFVTIKGPTFDPIIGNKYTVIVDFKGASTVKNSLGEDVKFFDISIIPTVTYISNKEVVNAEGIEFSLSEQGEKYVQDKKIEVDNRGQIIFYEKVNAFSVTIHPASSSGAGTSAVVTIAVK